MPKAFTALLATLTTVLALASLACSGSSESPAAARAVAETTPLAVATPTVAALPPTATAAPATATPPPPEATPTPPAPTPTPTPRPLPFTPAPTAPPPLPTPVPVAAPPTSAASLPPPAPIAEGPLDVTLETKGMSFTPHQIHGNAGQQVTVTLVGSDEAHTFTITSLGVDVNVPARGRTTARFVVRAVDSITPFYCKNHGSATSGMHGLLIFH